VCRPSPRVWFHVHLTTHTGPAEHEDVSIGAEEAAERADLSCEPRKRFRWSLFIRRSDIHRNHTTPHIFNSGLTLNREIQRLACLWTPRHRPYQLWRPVAPSCVLLGCDTLKLGGSAAGEEQVFVCVFIHICGCVKPACARLPLARDCQCVWRLDGT